MSNFDIVRQAFVRLRRRWPYAIVVMLIAGIPTLLMTLAGNIYLSRFTSEVISWLETTALQSGWTFSEEELLRMYATGTLPVFTPAQVTALLQAIAGIMTPGLTALLLLTAVSPFLLAFLSLGACAYADRLARGEDAAIPDVFSQRQLFW